MTNLLRLFLVLLPFSLQAQFTYVLDQDVPVKNADGSAVPMPWVGGLNAAHYNTMDLDNDGKDDLVLYDRNADKIITFLNRDNQYQYAPEYESFFPDEVTNWILLRDYNCDGKKDIFTGDILGIKVFTNVTQPGQPMAWKQFFFYSGPGNTKSSVLLSLGFSGLINVQLQFDDLPSLLDADGDGDLDLFDMRFVGNGTVEYHKNFSIERFGTCDSLTFERQTQRWGGVTECTCGNFAFNDEDCPPPGGRQDPTGGRTEHAGGKSLLILDANGDATLDMLYSEATCSNLYYLPNQGTLDAPSIQSFSIFPQPRPVNFLVYPAAFYEDLDFDGTKDLVSIPNIFAKTFLNSDLAHSNWLYKNTGTNASPSFSFAQDNFMQDKMIDVGDNSVPAFADYDGDGDYDLFVSENTSNGTDIVATVKLYKNTGTTAAPEFTLDHDDAWGFSGLSFYNLKIQFIDVNGDNKIDLVFTGTALQNGVTNLYYVLNTANSGISLGNQQIQPTGFQIFASENISVVDVDRDGLVDLLVGKTNGSVEYWKNNGSAASPSFALQTSSYLGLSSTVLRQNLTISVADLDADGKTDMLIGNQDGRITVINDFRTAVDATTGATQIVYNPIAQAYQARNMGGRIWTAPANLFGTTKPAIVVGNILGGLSILRNDDGALLPENATIEVYPNPSPKNGNVTIKADRNVTLQIFTSVGHRITGPIQVPGNSEYGLNVPNLAAGVYILRFTQNSKTFVKRLVVY
ncbi:FG-GAP-like repeat-containing protein [Chryseolinea soli]|uniref:T9SS C-terminal target domain-containing protein n=1 Tax=Chryseolinea soli TaxID=2321403 RepID=A0A385SGE8_9BACT|nr:FG-GAP-like repeat-containing protein [Chryseolinea soli]AYB30823.1 T9SS C-terminal target domain-containing protein [Chryseolinea soli]